MTDPIDVLERLLLAAVRHEHGKLPYLAVEASQYWSAPAIRAACEVLRAAMERVNAGKELVTIPSRDATLRLNAAKESLHVASVKFAAAMRGGE